MPKRRPPLSKKVRRTIRAALTYYDNCLAAYGVDFEDVDSSRPDQSFGELIEDNRAAFSWLNGIERGRGS